MLHVDMYCVCDFKTEEELGYVAVALDPGTTSSFSYYYRTKSGEYSHLIHISNMDLREVVELEDDRLWELVRKQMGQPDIRCKYRRLGEGKMRAIAEISPSITTGSWLINQINHFTEDESEETS